MPRILVVAPNWIGDALMAQPLLARLLSRTPGARIDVLAPEWVAPVARRMAEVAEVIAVPLRHKALQLGSRLPFPEVSLTMPGADQSLDLDLTPEEPQPRIAVYVGGSVLELPRANRRDDLILR